MSCGEATLVGPTFFLGFCLPYLIVVDVKIGRGPVLWLTQTPMPPNGTVRSRDRTEVASAAVNGRPLSAACTLGEEGADRRQEGAVTSIQRTSFPFNSLLPSPPNVAFQNATPSNQNHGVSPKLRTFAHGHLAAVSDVACQHGQEARCERHRE